MIRILLFVLLIGISIFTEAQIDFMGEWEAISPLNSSSGENYLFFDADKSSLYFTRTNHPDNRGGTSDSGDIWMAELDSSWKTPKWLKWNDSDFTSPIGFSPDGNYFLFSRVWRERGRYYGQVMAARPNGSSEPVEVEVPYLKNRSPIQTGFISANGTVLLLSLENNLGYGVDDLYVVQLDDKGKWTSPRNLGNQVNTPFQEITPFLAADNRTLVYASNGLGGEGSFDLFITQRLDETWQNWSKPRNLGPLINSKGAETSFTMATGATHAYFVSTQNSDGYGDVKKIALRSEIEEDTTSTRPFDLARSVAPPPMLNLNLMDRRSRQPIVGEAKVVTPSDTFFLMSNTLGEIDILVGGNFEVELKSKGYFSVNKRVSMDSVDGNVQYPIWLEPLTTGNVIALNNVLFYRGTANFIEGSEQDLSLVVEMMNENPEVDIFLRGHTDNVGNATLNEHLSKERVLEVEAFLVRSGISEDRIEGKGYGGAVPIASNEKEETRKLNRRVEFEIIRN